jgi:hypothetical protein
MFPIQFQADLIFFDFPDDILQSKIEKQWGQIISLFHVNLNRKFYHHHHHHHPSRFRPMACSGSEV